MPWSKIVKHDLYSGEKIERYILEEVEEPKQDSLTPDEVFPAEAARGTLPISFPSVEQPPPFPTYEQGYDEGLKAGEIRGRAEGEAKGFAEGEARGFTEGKAQGFAEGEARGFAEGKAQGFAEGETKGFACGEAVGKKIREEELREITETHKFLLRLVEDFKYLTETYVSEAESDLLEMVIAVAEKVIKKELTQDHEGMIKMISAALKEISPVKSAVLRVSPHDLERLTQRAPEILEAVGGIGFLKIESDPKLTPGDPILETADRIVDARPIMQLEAIKMKLLPKGGDETPADALPGSD